MPDPSKTYFSDNWKTIGVLATVVIVLSVPLYLLKNRTLTAVSAEGMVAYVGKESCVECHQSAYNDWLGSHHDMAMDSATVQTVRGDFSDSYFNHNGEVHHFFKKDNRFWVNTKGPDGLFNDFEVAFTFGYEPLQQYLVPFEDGRLQCLPLAWDTEREMWFHLADTIHQRTLHHHDWLYWTNQAQNWNGMCADCHSTNLEKNYNVEKRSYQTTWSEIDVSCEACHGPASKHLDWAKLPEGSRPMNTNTGLLIKTSDISNVEYVDNCARCHSRRSILSDFDPTHREMLDLMVPSKAVQPYYYPDGQILDEDYVYTSFTQSKMYTKDVKCNDCHNVHSTRLKMRGNALCTQCHQQNMYDTPEHHFHKMPGENLERIINNTSAPGYEEGEGALCVNCHMTGRFYMGNDYRRDHSFRIPRPDLTMSIGSPNACNDCHTDKSASWSQSFIQKWYGTKSRAHYGTVFAKAQSGDTTVIDGLIYYAMDELVPIMVRATAVELMRNYNSTNIDVTIKSMLESPEALLRHAALGSFHSTRLEDYLRHVFPLLNDPARAIRSEAAYRLSEIPRDMLNAAQVKQIDEGLEEFQTVNQYMGDFPGGQLNLGNMYLNQGKANDAVKAFESAIRIDSLFYQASANLAVLYNQLGRNHEAEKLLRKLTIDYPEMPDFNYSLALLLAEMGKRAESKAYFLKAAELMPDRSRIWYNLAIMEQQDANIKKAETYYQKALQLEPGNEQYRVALENLLQH